MSAKNRRLVADEPVELENNRLKLETSGNVPNVLEESIEYNTSNEGK